MDCSSTEDDHHHTSNNVMSGYREPTFDRFIQLPWDIRILIWEAILRAPRVITVSRITRMVQIKGTPYKNRDPCASVGPVDAYPPAILHVSRESRYLGLKVYRYAFHGRLRRPIYFNFALDYLHFENGHALPVFEYPRDLHNFGKVDKKETRQKIQRVIVGEPAFDRYESYERSDSYAKSIRWSIGRYQALNIVIFQTPSKDFDDYNSVMWCLSGILKPTVKKWGKFAPRTIVPVSSETMFAIESAEIVCEVSGAGAAAY